MSGGIAVGGHPLLISKFNRRICESKANPDSGHDHALVGALHSRCAVWFCGGRCADAKRVATNALGIVDYSEWLSWQFGTAPCAVRIRCACALRNKELPTRVKAGDGDDDFLAIFEVTRRGNRDLGVGSIHCWHETRL